MDMVLHGASLLRVRLRQVYPRMDGWLTGYIWLAFECCCLKMIWIDLSIKTLCCSSRFFLRFSRVEGIFDERLSSAEVRANSSAENRPS